MGIGCIAGHVWFCVYVYCDFIILLNLGQFLAHSGFYKYLLNK